MWLPAFLILASAISAAPPVPPAPILTSGRERGLATWTVSEVQCRGGVALPAAAIRPPGNSLSWANGTRGQTVTVTFDIDGQGRAVSIAGTPWGSDLGPALAASRFPAIARQGCSATFSSQVAPIASAPLADLVAYSVSPVNGALSAEGWARIRDGGTCGDRPVPQPLIRAFPDFGKIAGTSGEKQWTVIGYDLDSRGRPVNVRRTFGSGDAGLDAASIKAVRQSRFAGGARTGCTYRYWRGAETVLAPPMPDADTLRPAGADCSGERPWVTPPMPRFPLGYRARKIEGWAIVGYDIAPWGAVGNVKVLASQPAADFGQAATAVLPGARMAASSQGASGCVQVFKFQIDPKDADEPQDGAPAD